MTSTHSQISKKLTRQILIGLSFGIAFGSVFNLMFDSFNTEAQSFLKAHVLDGVLATGGSLFVSGLKMLVVPVVFVSLVLGICSFKDLAKLGRLGVKTFFYYIATTAAAVIFAILAALMFQPGRGFEVTTSATLQEISSPSFWQVLRDLVPANPIKAMSDGDMLPLIIFAILFGVAINMSKEKGVKTASLFESLDSVVMNLVLIVMSFAPIGVFCLVAKVFSDKGITAIVALGSYFMVVLGVLLFHLFVFYPLILKFFSGLSPLIFFKKFKPPMLFAFSTSSSNATIPVTIDAVENELGVSNNVASFTIPFGATINMDGTAIMQGVATIFIAQVYGVDLSFTNILTIITTAVLASVGTAGVPGVGLVMLAMVLKSVGLPLEGISLIIGVDRLLDMSRTVVNVTGDAIVTCIVAKSEREIDLVKYNQK